VQANGDVVGSFGTTCIRTKSIDARVPDDDSDYKEDNHYCS
jgi:hypothetical protein